MTDNVEAGWLGHLFASRAFANEGFRGTKGKEEKGTLVLQVCFVPHYPNICFLNRGSFPVATKVHVAPRFELLFRDFRTNALWRLVGVGAGLYGPVLARLSQASRDANDVRL